MNKLRKKKITKQADKLVKGFVKENQELIKEVFQGNDKAWGALYNGVPFSMAWGALYDDIPSKISKRK